MNTILKYTAGILMTGLILTACSPEEFVGADPSGIPTMEGRTITVNTDQETNTATFTISGDFQECYPMWYLDGKPYSTQITASYSSVNRGDHTLKVHVINRNGMSQGSLSGQFTFNTSKIDFSSYFNKLSGKEWRIDYAEVGHMGCGEPGTDGSNWWSAAVEDKKDWGVYDDRITFSHAETDEPSAGTYTYNPGKGGTVYVNKGCTAFASFNPNNDADFMATVSEQTATFTLVPGVFNNDDCVYMHFPSQTLLPYIPNDEIYNAPVYRIEALTATRLALVCDNGGIAWRLVFTSKPDATVFEGFDASSAFNMFKGITPNMSFYYNPDPGWGNEQTALFESKFSGSDNEYEINIPSKCYAPWQAQVHFHTALTTSAANSYDFSVILNSDKDQNGVTVKLTNEADNAYIFEEKVDLKAGQDYVFWKSDMAGVDLQDVKVVFDFGGADDNTTVSIRNIVIKDHANDDGTVLPKEEDKEVAVMDWDYESADNLWKAVDEGTAFDAFGYYFADNGWGPLENMPVATHSGNQYEITIPDGMGSSQWQGQFHIDTKLTASAAKAYNLYLVVEADKDCPGVTIKFTDSGDDNYFCVGRHDLSADEEYVFKLQNATLKEGKDATALRLFFDFAGSPAGTNVKISKIYFEEVK